MDGRSPASSLLAPVPRARPPLLRPVPAPSPARALSALLFPPGGAYRGDSSREVAAWPGADALGLN